MAGGKRPKKRGDTGSRDHGRSGRGGGGGGGIVGKLFVLLVLASVGYLAWKVPVGGRTMVQHVARWIDSHQPDPTAPAPPPAPAAPRTRRMPAAALAEEADDSPVVEESAAAAPPAPRKALPGTVAAPVPAAVDRHAAPAGEERLTASDRAAVDRLLK